MEDLDNLLRAAREFADSIAFFDEDRGFVAYSLSETLKLREKLSKAAFEFGRQERAQEALQEKLAAKPTCDNHHPIQHRDGKPPWCRSCGLDENFKESKSIFDRYK